LTLIKTSVLTAISTIIKVFTAFFINKVLAMYVGPSGLAVIGQLQNFSSIVMTFANGAITSGVIKYTAEHREDIEQKSKFFSTAIVITLTCSIIVGLLLNLFSSYLSTLILKSDEYTSVFVIFGFTIILFALNTLLMSILNGQKEIKKYVTVNIVSSLFSLGLTSLLIMSYGLIGALYALVVNQSVIFFVTLAFVIKSSWFKFEYFKQNVDKQSLMKLGKYSAMALTSALTVPVSHLIVRNYIGENLSWDDAGYWQGIWYISSMYLMVVTTSLSIYYLPRLSEIKDYNELKKEILNGYKIILPIATILALGIYTFRELVIEIAFTEKFMPMVELFKWQLIGDVIKIASWLLGYIILAKAMTRVFIYTEIGFSILFVLLSKVFIDSFGLIGITYAFSLNYSMHFMMMIFIFTKRFR
jgi:polysaccharide transporter, PST family